MIMRVMMMMLLFLTIMLTTVNQAKRTLQMKFYVMLKFPCSPELRVAPSHRTGLAFHAAMLKHQVVKYDHADESEVICYLTVCL